MNTEKLDKLKEFELSSGNHKSLEAGACIMEMVAWFADEPWSDHPQCACPVLTEYAIRLNDAFKTEDRQRLKEFIPILVGTHENDSIQIARKRLIRWRNVTVTFPLILDMIKVPEIAAELRKFENSLENMALAGKFLEIHKEAIRKAAYAYAYAYANAYANAYAYANAHADAYANADADAYADAYAYANANTNTYSDTYSDTNTYAYANALRQKIVDVAIETLRLAIEVKL